MLEPFTCALMASGQASHFGYCEFEVDEGPDFLGDLVHFFGNGLSACLFGDTVNDELRHSGVGIDVGGCDVNDVDGIGDLLCICDDFFHQRC